MIIIKQNGRIIEMGWNIGNHAHYFERLDDWSFAIINWLEEQKDATNEPG